MKFSFTQSAIIITAAFTLLVLGFTQHKPSRIPAPQPPTQAGVPAPGFEDVKEKKVVAATEDSEITDTSDWVEYRNAEYGFLLMHPSNWQWKEIEREDVVFDDAGYWSYATIHSLYLQTAKDRGAHDATCATSSEEECKKRVSSILSVSQNVDVLTEIASYPGISEEEQIQIGELMWARYFIGGTVRTGRDPGSVLFVTVESTSPLLFGAALEEEEEVTAILSTFEFIDR